MSYEAERASNIAMPKPILVFDVDGTLTKARLKIDDEMRDFLAETRKRIPLAVVGGSDLEKIVEQLGETLSDVLSQYDFVFSENGLLGYKGNELLPSFAIQDHMGEDRLQEVINATLSFFSTLKLPVKRGNFIEFRKGMLNLCPVGRSCSYAERERFTEYDKEHGVRRQLIEQLQKLFPDYGLEFSIGGQISVDVYPIGWDKTFCLQYITSHYDTIHFFGDKTAKGGNDHAIFMDTRTIGHNVEGPSDTRDKVIKVLEGL